MMRRTVLTSLTVALVSGAVLHAATASLRILPTVRDDSVIVSVELADAYTDEVREAIASGLRTTFTYDLELRMDVPAWTDRTVATAVVTVSDHYDTLTRVHNLARSVDGRVEEALVTSDGAQVQQWLTSLSRVPLCKTSKLDPRHEYYVRISASVRPPGASLLGWASAVTNQAKFTFIP
jgi:Domain of unknown function (DUF4390)